MNPPKTIFFTGFFNLVVRNILETDAFALLKSQPNLRIVLLVPEKKGEFFQKEFGGGNIIVEEVPFRPLSKINLLFHVLSWNLLHNRSKKIHKLVQLGKDRNYLRYWFTSFLSWLGSFGLVRKFFRWLDYWLVPAGGYDALFAKYQPQLVFATDIQDLRVQEYSDTYLVRESRRKGIKSIAMSRSWDAMTTKGLLRTLPDILAVQNNQIKDWAVKYHSVPADVTAVVGYPHYDHYILGKRTPRKEFFEKLKLDPNRKLIFVTPPSDIWTGDTSFNKYLLKILAGVGEQVVVRFPIFGGAEISDFTPPPYMVFDIPKSAARLEESLLRRGDDEHLADLIYHSDVAVTSPSSIVLDAAIFNKPIVLIGLDGEKPKPFWDSLRRYYEYEHQQAVINQGSLKIARSPQELVELARYYLANPSIGREGNSAIAKNACVWLDGKSGERLANLILHPIHN